MQIRTSHALLLCIHFLHPLLFLSPVLEPITLTTPTHNPLHTIPTPPAFPSSNWDPSLCALLGLARLT